MPCDIIVGTQWGDEGKAKVVDLLSKDAKYICRFQGGANAGHTVVIGEKKYVFHLVPSGILHPEKICLVGAGMVVDIAALFAEIDDIKKQGIKTDGRIKISGNTHLIMPYHKILDVCSEKTLESNKKIGTTGKGIGPAYTSKAARKGLLAYDLINGEYEEKVRSQVAEANFLVKHQFKTTLPEDMAEFYTDDAIDAEKVIEHCKSIIPRITPLIENVSLLVRDALKKDEYVLAEGAQGTGLDISFGTYPFVTSSHPIAGGACTGIGIGPTNIRDVHGIMKAYVTRVGSGPFPTELEDETGEKMRAIGSEFGATTGRPRRCGWYDGVFGKYSCWVNGITKLIITKMDVLDDFDEILFCTGYEIDGVVHEDFTPQATILSKVKPVYKSFPGWKCSTKDITKYQELPQNARNYLEFMEDFLETPISIVSVGPGRAKSIFK